MAKRRKIPNISFSKPKRTVQSGVIPVDTDTPKFILSNDKWMDGVRIDNEMTTCLKDQEQFASKSAILMTRLIPKMMQDWKRIFPVPRESGGHCHKLSDDALTRANKVIEAIYGNQFADEAEHLQNVWQFGFGQGVRLVCGISENKEVFPLFVDYHHLIEPDDNYNQHDFSRYRYCPRRQREYDEVPEEIAVSKLSPEMISFQQEELYDAITDMCDSCSDRLGKIIK